MRLEPLESPRILPAWVVCHTVRLVGGDHRLHFAAGRVCAARAMAQLGLPAEEVGRGSAGEPLWPSGVTGSITHKGDYVSAAVARATEVLSLGIDAETIVSADRAARVAPLVMLPAETSVGGADLPLALRVSLLFSIKEAVFKCLYPLVQRRFYYDALAIVEIDLAQGAFRAEVQSALSGFDHPGTELTGRMVVGPRQVHSAVWLPARRDAAASQ